MADEMNTATPAEQVAAEQVQQDASIGSESSTEQTQEQETSQEQQQETPEEKAKREPWFQKRIGELTREKYEARRAADEARQQAEQYRQNLAQLQAGEQPDQGGQRQLTQAEIDRLADERAAQKLAEQSFQKAIDTVRSQGESEFKDGFRQSVANLTMVGMSDQFLQLLVDSDMAHKVIHHLGQEANLDDAARILRMHPVQQARELTKLEFKLNQPPAPKPVSKAPAPITPLGASATSEVDPAKVSDAEWYERVYLKNRK